MDFVELFCFAKKTFAMPATTAPEEPSLAGQIATAKRACNNFCVTGRSPRSSPGCARDDGAPDHQEKIVA